MKKFLSMILALALVMSLGTVAFADTTKTIESSDGSTWTGGDGSGNEAQAEVNVQCKDLVAPGTVYYVTVVIPDLTYTYNAGEVGDWNPSTLQYGDTTGTGWQGGNETNAPAKTIKVTNKSNADIKFTAVYVAEATIGDGLDGEFSESADSGVVLTKASATPDAANYVGEGQAQEKSFTFTLTGTPEHPEQLSTSSKVGTVTITIEKNA